jgi:diguanylate cyclase (GGDEF)-like protein
MPPKAMDKSLLRFERSRMPIEMIAGVQLALYGLAWALAAWLVVEERPALLCWTSYAGLHALSALAAAADMAAGNGPPLGSLLMSVLGFAAAARGVDLFTAGRARLDRWGVLILVPTFVAMLLAELLPSPAERRLWVAQPYSLGLAALLLTYALLTWPRLRTAHGRAIAAAVLAPLWLTGLLGAVAFVVRLGLDPAAYARVQGAARLSGVLMALVSSAIFNFAFFFLLIARLVGRLREGARVDHLTGLANRRSIESVLEAACQQHQRTGAALAVALVDIDQFKSINDGLGHAAGDNALRFAAAALRERTRPYDSVGRWGGDEFLLVMPGADAAGARQVCERLRTALAEQSAARGGTAITVTVGVALGRHGNDTPAALVERADGAMYEAKRAGRNRVVVAD